MDSCVITGIERATPMLKFDVCGVEFRRMASVRIIGESVQFLTL